MIHNTYCKWPPKPGRIMAKKYSFNLLPNNYCEKSMIRDGLCRFFMSRKFAIYAISWIIYVTLGNSHKCRVRPSNVSPERGESYPYVNTPFVRSWNMKKHLLLRCSTWTPWSWVNKLLKDPRIWNDFERLRIERTFGGKLNHVRF